MKRQNFINCKMMKTKGNLTGLSETFHIVIVIIIVIIVIIIVIRYLLR